MGAHRADVIEADGAVVSAAVSAVVLASPAPASRPGRTDLRSLLLERLDGPVVVLSDRRVALSRRPIDLMVVAASGVWVLDAPFLPGRVERRQVGGFFRTEERLFVGGRDQTRLLDELAWRLGAVVTTIGDDAVEVHGVLCLAGSEPTVEAEPPFRMDDLWVADPSSTAGLLDVAGPLTSDDVGLIGERLADRSIVA